MASDDRLDLALERIESAILPGIASLLEGLVDTAALARPGIDAENYAVEIRTLTLQVEELARQMKVVTPAPARPAAAAATSAA